MRKLLSLAFMFVMGYQMRPPVAYDSQIISFNGVPSGHCEIYQQAINSSNGQLSSCNPTTKAWVIVGAAVSGPGSLASLGACTAGLEGSLAAVNDSTNVVTLGNTVTNGGTRHVLAYCDGSSWIIAATQTGF